MSVVDSINQRFGQDIVRPARLKSDISDSPDVIAPHGAQKDIGNRIKKAEGGRFGLSLKGWGYDLLSVSCLKHYLNNIDMSINNMNKNYTNSLKGVIVC